MDDLKQPPISEYLVEFLKQRFSTGTLLFEGNSEGLERLGFVKGAMFILESLEGMSKMQREDVEN